MVRLKDLAARAGVSIMTVSKVLREAPEVAPATRALVRGLAQEMGYVPDSLAQSLRTRTTKLVGLVIAASTNPIFARLISGAEQRAYEEGYSLILSHTLNAPEREDAVLRRLIARRVDGILVSPVHQFSPDAPIYDEIRKRGIPIVVLGHRPQFCRGFLNVQSDDLAASLGAVQHLLALGHRKIGFLAGPHSAPWAQERLEGYRHALRDAAINEVDDLVFQAGSTIEDGERCARQILQENVLPTALFAVNDLVAIGAANGLLNHGIRIPEEMSIVGFGNIFASEHFRVPLTTVHQPQLRSGQIAVELLLRLMKGEPVDSVRLPCEFLIRSSTALPRH